MAGAAPTHPAAIVLKLDVVVEGHVQHRLALGCHVGLRGLAILKLEGDVNGIHKVGFLGAIAGTKVRTTTPESKLQPRLVV